MGNAKLSASLPGDRSTNGLNALSEDMTAQPEQTHIALVVFDTSKITLDTDTDEAVPTARIRRIEPITRTDDYRQAQRLVRRAFEERTGETTLPYDLESDLDDAFENGTNGEGDA